MSKVKSKIQTAQEELREKLRTAGAKITPPRLYVLGILAFRELASQLAFQLLQHGQAPAPDRSSGKLALSCVTRNRALLQEKSQRHFFLPANLPERRHNLLTDEGISDRR